MSHLKKKNCSVSVIISKMDEWIIVDDGLSCWELSLYLGNVLTLDEKSTSLVDFGWGFWEWWFSKHRERARVLNIRGWGFSPKGSHLVVICLLGKMLDIWYGMVFESAKVCGAWLMILFEQCELIKMCHMLGLSDHSTWGEINHVRSQWIY